MIQKYKQMSNYVPHPIDTSNIILPDELMTLVEQMSENVHEVWAKTRIDQGWTYGPKRNDAQKEHPSLIPYDKLSEEEKKLDRNTCTETLKLIIYNGFSIFRTTENH